MGASKRPRGPQHGVEGLQPVGMASGLCVPSSRRAPVGKRRFLADHVIGGDGAHSDVRKALGLAFEGFTYEDRFLLIRPTWSSRSTSPVPPT